MSGIIFLTYIFFLGLIFGLNFYPRIPISIISFGSFLFGAVLVAFSTLVLRIFNVLFIGNQYLIFLTILLSIPSIVLFLFSKPQLYKKDYSYISLTLTIFLITNVFFHYFNFSLATIDSFSLILLGRINANEGMSPYVLNSFTSWGVIIPTLQSFCLYFGIDYLETLEVNFSMSLLMIFSYMCYHECQNIMSEKNKSLWISILTVLVLVLTPMYIIQTFYIHTNLPAAAFYLFVTSISWRYIQDSEKSWLPLLFVSLIGLSMCRAETFIYGIPVLILIFAMNKENHKLFLLCSSLFLGVVTSWMIYLVLNITSGTLIFDKQRISILIIALIVFLILINVFKNMNIILRLRQIIAKFYLLPFFALNIIFTLIKPGHMISSNGSILQNIYFVGDWGIVFWIWSILLVFYFVIPRSEIATFLNNIIISVFLIVSSLGFFRSPYRLTWNDSANRLLTLVFPLIFLLLSVTLSTLLEHRKTSNKLLD